MMSENAKMNHRLYVCESENRWTRMIRRQESRLDAEIIQIPGHRFLDRFYDHSDACLLLIELDETNFIAVSEWILKEKRFAKSTIFVGLFRSWQPKNRWPLRMAGLDACYFSLADVQSVIQLAQRYFQSLTDADGSASEMVLDGLPDFEAFRESLPLPE